MVISRAGKEQKSPLKNQFQVEPVKNIQKHINPRYEARSNWTYQTLTG